MASEPQRRARRILIYFLGEYAGGSGDPSRMCFLLLCLNYIFHAATPALKYGRRRSDSRFSPLLHNQT